LEGVWWHWYHMIGRQMLLMPSKLNMSILPVWRQRSIRRVPVPALAWS